MVVKVSGQLGSVVNLVGKESGKPYRSFQLVQTAPSGRVFIINGRCYDPALDLKVGSRVELTGSAEINTYKGVSSLQFSVYAPKG